MSAEKLIITNDDVANAHQVPTPSYSSATIPTAAMLTPPSHATSGDKQTLVFVGLTAGLLLAIAGAAFLFVRNPELAGTGPATSAKETRTAAAILRVLKADKAESDKYMGTLPQNPTPSQLAGAIGGYCDAASRIDATGCPATFTVAYRHHLQAHQDVRAILQQMPEGFVDSFVLGLLNGLGGELDGGASRIDAVLRDAANQVERTWQDVERIAASHDVAL